LNDERVAQEISLITPNDQGAMSGSPLNEIVVRNRWYVLGVLTVVYALNIAARTSSSRAITVSAVGTAKKGAMACGYQRR
jgi:hypothetical protein